MQHRRPRETGELLTDAMAVLRRHFKTLTPLALPFCALDLVLREGGQAVLASARTLLGPGAGKQSVAGMLELVAAGSAGVGMLLGSMILMQLLTVAVVAATSEDWHARRPTVAHALTAVVARGASQVLTFTLFVAALSVVFVVPVLLGVVAGTLLGGDGAGVVPVGLVVGAGLGLVVAVVLAIAVALRFGLYTQAVVLESLVAGGAFTRSTALMASRGLGVFSGAKFRLSVLLFVAFALAASLQALFTVPRLVLATAMGWSTADGVPPLLSMPLAFIVPFALVEVALNALIAPLVGVLQTLFYFDMRVRTEALDLDARLTHLEAAVDAR